MSLGLAGYTGLNKNDESYLLSQGLHSVQTINNNPNTRIDNNNPSSPDPYYNSVYSVALQRVTKALQYAYRDRKVKKREFR